MLRLAVAASLLVVVAGCSDPQPQEPEPSTSTKPAVAAPTMPAQAKEDSPEGAAAFVGYYIKVLNHAAATGDVTELSRLSDPKCEGCQEYIDLYQDTYANGGYFKGGDWTPGDMRLEVGDGETVATMNVETAPTKYRDRADSVERSGPAETNRISFAVVGEASARRISQLALGDAA